MKGIIRRLDYLGRITLPIEYRRTFGIKERDHTPIGIYIKDNVIRLHMNGEKFFGMVRKLDVLGRLTLPIEMRRSLNFDSEELVDMWIEDGEICLRKASLQCVICGDVNEDKLLSVDGVLICRSCGAKIAGYCNRLLG